MKNIFILNLTRLGDMLQTWPTIAGLREVHPEARITVCVDRNFAEVCRGLPGIDRVWEIELDRLGRMLLDDRLEGLRGAYHMVEEFVEALRAEHFDLGLNYSSSRMSAVLMALIGIADTRGWTMTADGHRLIAQRWSRLFSASALNRRQAPFNLVDCYKRAAGVTGGPRRLSFMVPDGARDLAGALLTANGHDGEPLIAFQLGASRAVRRWPAASFIALGRALHERLGARVLLCGGGGEQQIASEIATALGPVAIDTTGRTSVPVLAALLGRADLLVTGDTGPMHLAVAVGTPVVALFFGPALPVDTGPYAADELCLHADVACAPCDHNVTCLQPFCREVLAPEAVAEAVVARRAGDWTAVAAAADRWPALRWYRTGFDPEGLFDLVPLGARPPSPAEELRRCYRMLWKRVLDGTPPARRTPLPRAAAVARQFAALASSGASEARVVEALAVAGASADLDRLEEAAQRLEARDEQLIRLGTIHDPVALLTQMFRFDKESIEGDDVAQLARATRRLHEDLESQAQLLLELLEPAADAATPAAEGGHDEHFA